MKNKIFIPLFLFILLSCTTSNKEREMQEVTVFENYMVKLPLKASLVKKNRWKIESSSPSHLTTIIASELTQTGSIANCMDAAFQANYSDKLHFDSEKQINKPNFNVYIRKYKGTAGVSPVSFTCLVLDEQMTLNRFILELNSINNGHTYIIDSIVDSFKKKVTFTNSAIVEDSYQTFASSDFTVKCNCKLFVNQTLH